MVLLLCERPGVMGDEKDKIATVNKEIEVINAKTENLKKEEKSILNDIYAIELQYEKAVIENNKLKMQLKDTEEEIASKNSEKELLDQDIIKSKENLRKILRILYKMGDNSYLKLLVRIDSFDQLFKNYRFFIVLVSYKSMELEKLKTNILRLTKVKQELQTSHNHLLTLQKQKEGKIRVIRSLKQEKLDLIKKTNNDRQDYLQLLDELRDESTRLNDMIYGKQTKRPPRTLDLDHLKGKLNWPLKGKVISSFGKKKSTRFDTYIINNGINIQPTISSDVHAIYSGEVVFADYFKGYGNLVILQHSKNLYSLYGHCEKILKLKGDYVEEGELISIAGDTGSTTGKSLYFEIRTQSTAQDPLDWLRKTR